MAAASILATGSYLPSTAVTNQDLAARLDTSDEWIQSHIGIRERRIAVDEDTSEMALRAAEAALSRLPEGVALDGIIVATQTPDKIIPATACILQHRLGLSGCFAVDMNAACSGFLYGLHFAAGLLASGSAKRLLVIGAERMSRLVNWQDRRTCVIFGDGAGAVVLGACEGGEPRLADVEDSVVCSDGAGEEVIHVPAGGSRLPLSRDNVDDGLQYVHMDGRRVFSFAVDAFVSTVRQLAARAGLELEQLSYVLPHQANLRIIEEAMGVLGLPMERTLTHIDRYGNTSAASIAIALDENARARRFRPGEVLALVAFGTGLAWGGVLLRWVR
jgi:3-oxoacyl-[acyl-carrier-protein] synthase-3